jgi:hypothetical protein
MQSSKSTYTNIQFSHIFSYHPQYILREIEPKASHTTLVFIDCSGAVLLWIFGIAEEHAFIPSGFFDVTYAAWLSIIRNEFKISKKR